jgi:hypothetical protein
MRKARQNVGIHSFDIGVLDAFRARGGQAGLDGIHDGEKDDAVG